MHFYLTRALHNYCKGLRGTKSNLYGSLSTFLSCNSYKHSSWWFLHLSSKACNLLANFWDRVASENYKQSLAINIDFEAISWIGYFLTSSIESSSGDDDLLSHNLFWGLWPWFNLAPANILLSVFSVSFQ